VFEVEKKEQEERAGLEQKGGTRGVNGIEIEKRKGRGRKSERGVTDYISKHYLQAVVKYNKRVLNEGQTGS
jgi:hypothetical protein